MSVNSPELVQFVIFVNADWSVLTLIIQPIIESDQSLSRWFVESSTHINVVSTPNLHKFCVSVVSLGPPKLQKRQKQQKRVQSGSKQAESMQSGWILEQPGEADILSH